MITRNERRLLRANKKKFESVKPGIESVKVKVATPESRAEMIARYTWAYLWFVPQMFFRIGFVACVCMVHGAEKAKLAWRITN